MASKTEKMEDEVKSPGGNVEITVVSIPQRGWLPQSSKIEELLEERDKFHRAGFRKSGGQTRPGPTEALKTPGSASSDLFSPSRSRLESAKCCDLCMDFFAYKDWDYWNCIEPALTVVNGKEKYRVKITPGRYQCGVTGLRWKSSCEAELEYCLEDWDQFSEFLERERSTPCGPLFDIRVISGELTAVHLPHFLCSVHRYRNVVKVLHSEDSGVSLEKCWLFPFFAIPPCEVFAPQGVVIRSELLVKAHCDVVIYRTPAAHLTLHVYLVPWDLNMKASVEKREKDSVEILTLEPCNPLQLGCDYTLRTSCSSHITPQKLKLTYINKTLNCFEVFIKDAQETVFLHLSNKMYISEWGTIIRPAPALPLPRGLVPTHPESSPPDLKHPESSPPDLKHPESSPPDLKHPESSPLTLPIPGSLEAHYDDEIMLMCILMDAELQTTQKQFAKLSVQSPGAPSVHSSQRKSRSCCEFCSSLQDTAEWKIVDPETEGNLHYRVSSAAGRYECSASGLRWVCDGDVSLKYHFADWDLYGEDLRKMQFEPCGPLMDITVISGVLTEVHLPHVACLGSCPDSLKDEVRVLDVQDGGMFLEMCELTRFHAKLLHPTFSPKGLLIRSGFPVKVHCEVLIYQTLMAHLTLHVYLVTCDQSIIQKVENKEKNSQKIDKPGPENSLPMKSRYTVETRKEEKHFSSTIKPERLKLRYSPIKYCEVYIRNAEDDFQLHLINERKESVWDVEIRAEDYRSSSSFTSSDRQKALSMDYAVRFVDEQRTELIQRVRLVTPIADDLKPFIGDEKYSIITACKTPQEQMRALYEFLSGVERLEKRFYKSLLRHEPHLVEDLTAAD